MSWSLLFCCVEVGVAVCSELTAGIWEGPLHLTQLLLPTLRSHAPSTIVTIGSASTWRPMPGLAAYSASEVALQTMAEVIGAEVAGFGVRSLVFVTGDMRTPFVASSVDGCGLVPVCDVYKGTVVDYVM